MLWQTIAPVTSSDRKSKRGVVLALSVAVANALVTHRACAEAASHGYMGDGYLTALSGSQQVVIVDKTTVVTTRTKPST